MEQAVEDEARCQALNFSTTDTDEALAAFTEKRDAHFHRPLIEWSQCSTASRGWSGIPPW